MDEFKDAITHIIINDKKVLRQEVWRMCKCGQSSKNHIFHELTKVSTCPRSKCENFVEQELDLIAA